MYATLVVIVLALAQTLAGQAGTTYYVWTSGNDTNPGTIRAPSHHPACGEYGQARRHSVRLRRNLPRALELSDVWKGIGTDYIPKLSRTDFPRGFV
jgi:hypothetical protein